MGRQKLCSDLRKLGDETVEKLKREEITNLQLGMKLKGHIRDNKNFVCLIYGLVYGLNFRKSRFLVP